MIRALVTHSRNSCRNSITPFHGQVTVSRWLPVVFQNFLRSNTGPVASHATARSNQVHRKAGRDFTVNIPTTRDRTIHFSNPLLHASYTELRSTLAGSMFRTLKRPTAILLRKRSVKNPLRTLVHGMATDTTKSSSDKKPTNKDSDVAGKRVSALVEPVESVYVHPLSQIALLYMQSDCHDWIVRNGLDTQLQLHRDGTFVLEFPQSDAAETTTTDATTTSTTAPPPTPTAPRIWTSYDPVDKKHWLSYQLDNAHHRIMLQDNLMPAWQGRKKSLPERIQAAVQELVEAVDATQINRSQRT
jgi:hypothetical protein